ncbi:hypothetical protein B296_00017170 [Ensete ventricosum]|uniref:Uncharacterized protein n=1 Tax=Ensete ventricosum TaxID=4639 RepID=A0A427AI30_ENSVE|nr:hypothetical protein B296_00017170 [Ensete ventricosum]
MNYDDVSKFDMLTRSVAYATNPEGSPVAELNPTLTGKVEYMVSLYQCNSYIPPGNARDGRRFRARRPRPWRPSRQRGFLELDLVVGTCVEEHIPALDQLHIRALMDALDLILRAGFAFVPSLELVFQLTVEQLLRLMLMLQLVLVAVAAWCFIFGFVVGEKR